MTMNIFDKIDYIMEQEDKVLPKGSTKVNLDYNFDDKLFDRMANFIINLEPESLSDDQLGEVINMIDSLEVDVDDIQEGRMLAQKSKLSKNQYSKKWYRKNRSRIKDRKKRFKKNAEGRKMKRMKEIRGRSGRTSTNRKKLQYNRRIRSDR